MIGMSSIASLSRDSAAGFHAAEGTVGQPNRKQAALEVVVTIEALLGDLSLARFQRFRSQAK